MAKTQETIDLENKILKATEKQGVFGCFEVTIGWFGKERVDYMTYDTKGIWRCYEIKVSKSDFHSKAKKTFIGHYNYFVMPSKLYEQVKGEIPNHVGVYCGGDLVKRAKKQELQVEEEILKNSMIRSLHREFQKYNKSQNKNTYEKQKREIQRLKTECNNEHRYYKELSNTIRNTLQKISEIYNIDYKELRRILHDQY